jgi:hypothetical protein
LKQRFPNDIKYELYSDDEPVQAILHHTFLQFVTFKHNNMIKKYEPYCKDEIQPLIPTYGISFNRLCALPSGIVMLGIPNIDVNAARNEIREKMVNVLNL